MSGIFLTNYRYRHHDSGIRKQRLPYSFMSTIQEAPPSKRLVVIFVGWVLCVVSQKMSKGGGVSGNILNRRNKGRWPLVLTNTISNILGLRLRHNCHVRPLQRPKRPLLQKSAAVVVPIGRLVKIIFVLVVRQ